MLVRDRSGPLGPKRERMMMMKKKQSSPAGIAPTHS
jgi:hypothetical protein